MILAIFSEFLRKMFLWKYVAYIGVYREMGGGFGGDVFILYRGSNVKRSKNMLRYFF